MGITLAAALIAALAVGQPVGPDHVGCNVTEQLVEHWHPHLTIEHRGAQVRVPAQIGFVQTGGIVLCLYWLHTHDDSGTIHVESPIPKVFTLGDFFAVWGQPLARTRVGPYRGHVRAYVNGAPYTGAPQNIPLLDGEQILLRI
ncbi:MAG TPA: hypothetical protein VMF11_07885 [Candidatus Baltobacteraceae bacterium]|nr:hypothetical protein [Candidatus Baltobacteraceae bacterium]